MLNTYLNDNQGMPYPFYGVGSLPFPMSVITGLSLCLRSENAANNPLFAKSVVITADSVRMAICRFIGNTDGIELIGMFYANTDGFYTYIPSYISDAVYEDQTITPQMLRFVYADYAPIQGSTVSGNETIYNTELDAIIEDMQVFYSYVQANVGTVLSQITSYGHIQLGTIPESAIGTYLGTFYLDPSCVTYMSDAVYGYHTAYSVGYDTYPMNHAFEIRTSGLLTLTVDGSTAYVGVTADYDEAPLMDLGFSTRNIISFINGYTVSALPSNPYPCINFIDLDDKVKWTVISGHTVTGTLVSGGTDTYVPNDPLIIEVEGTSEFPNCYGGR